MIYHKMNIAGIDCELPLCPITDDFYIGAFVILGNTELTEAAARQLLSRAPEYDYIVTAECKGIPLAHEMAKLNNDKSYVIARKAPKLYMVSPIKVTLKSITTAEEQSMFLDWHDARRIKGKRVLLVDDVVSTGASLRALETLVNEAGGNIVGKMTILVEGDAQNRTDLVYLEKLPFFNPDGSIKE